MTASYKVSEKAIVQTKSTTNEVFSDWEAEIAQHLDHI